MKSDKSFLENLLANWPAKILSLGMAIILFMFNRVSSLEERFLSIPLAVVANDEFVPASQYPRTIKISLRGESNEIFPILDSDIQASINIEKVNSEGVIRVPVEITRKGSALDADPLEISLDPPEIALALEQRISRTVPVIPSFRGYLETGYELSGFVIDPPAVEINGPRSAIEKSRDVATDFIELTARNDGFVSRVKLLKKDPLVKFTAADAVEFRATVRKSIALRTFEYIPIATLNLAPNLAAVLSTQTGSVKLQASDQDLKDFSPDADLLSVDLTEIKRPGTYVLSVLVNPPSGFLSLAHEPDAVTVRITDAGR